MGLRLLWACPGLLWRLPRADLAADRRRRWKTSTWIASAWCCLHQNLAKSSLMLVHLGDILNTALGIKLNRIAWRKQRLEMQVQVQSSLLAP